MLVAEDEPFIALDLALAVEDAGGAVAGPAASVAEALALIDSLPIAAAIVDVNLIGGEVTPVVDLLMALGVPIILQTGVGIPAALAARFPGLRTHVKPCLAADLVAELAAMIAQRAVAKDAAVAL